MSKPITIKIVGGWMAMGNRWAVRGDTEQDAIRKFYEAEEKHKEIDARPLKTEQGEEKTKTP